MKITVCGHSLIHPRQYMLFEYMAVEDLAEVQVLSPSRWGSERGKAVHAHNYHHECLEPIGQYMQTFWLRGLEEHIKDFQPELIYIMEEPYTSFTSRLIRLAKKLNIPTAVFTWENVLDRVYPNEENVITEANILIAGNEGAKQRLIQMKVKAVEDKIAICPQTGINCNLFKPMLEVRKKYTCGYFGRLVKEKGIEYIENVVEEMNLKMLWIGGRGDMTPAYGDYLGWLNYLKLPEYYNKLLLFVTYPYAYNGYSEQMNFSIGEALACGIPVVSSDNGSISDVYGDAPILFVEEANEAALNHAIKSIFDNPTEGWAEEGIHWVSQNLSVPVIAQKLMRILKTV